jgi:hypothetical protein
MPFQHFEPSFPFLLFGGSISVHNIPGNEPSSPLDVDRMLPLVNNPKPLAVSGLGCSPLREMDNLNTYMKKKKNYVL